MLRTDGSLSLAPFYDVVWTSGKVEPGSPYFDKQAGPQAQFHRTNVELQFLLSALGSGVLGIGDKPGFANRTLIMQAVQDDGVLRKALRPLTPIDAMFGDSRAGVPEGAQIFSTTSSFAIDTGAQTDPYETDWLWHHIVGVNISVDFLLGPDDLSPPLTPHLQYVAYDYFNSGGCAHGAPSAGCVQPFGHGHPPLRLATTPANEADLGFGLWRVAAVCVGFASGSVESDGAGFALLGERTKYLAVAPQRVKRMQCTSGEFFVQWYGSAGEAVNMLVLDARNGVSNGTIVGMGMTHTEAGLGTMRCTVADGCTMGAKARVSN